MPLIPVVDAPQVESRPMPTPYSNIDTRGAFGEPLAEGLADVSKGIGQARQIALQAKGEADAAAVAKAESQLGDTINRTMYDPTKGFLAKQGHNAVDTYADTLQTLKASRDQISSNLANDAQRRIFDQRSMGTLQQTARQADDHQTRQLGVIKTEAFAAREKTALDTISLNYTDPKFFERERDNMQGYVLADAQTKGMPAEARAAFLQDWKAKSTETALSAFLKNGDGDGAQKFFDLHGNDLGSKKPDYEKLVRGASEDVAVERGATTVINSSRDQWGHIDRTRVEQSIASLPDTGPNAARNKGRIRELAERQAASNDKAWDDSNARLFQQAQTLYDSTKNAALSVGNINDPRVQVILRQLDSPQQQGGKYAEALRKGYMEDLSTAHTLGEWAKTRPADTGQTDVFNQFASLASTPEGRKQIASLDAPRLRVQWLQNMALADRKEAETLWRESVAKVNAPDNAELPAAALATVDEMALGKIIQDKDAKKWTPEQAATMAHVRSVATQTYRDMTKEGNGQTPTTDQLRKRLVPLVVGGKVPDTGLIRDDRTTRAGYEAEPEKYSGKTFYPEITPSQQAAVDAELTRQNIPVNDDTRRALIQKMSGLPLRPEDQPHLPTPRMPVRPPSPPSPRQTSAARQKQQEGGAAPKNAVADADSAVKGAVDSALDTAVSYSKKKLIERLFEPAPTSPIANIAGRLDEQRKKGK